MIDRAYIDKNARVNLAMMEVIEHFPPWRVADFTITPLNFRTNFFEGKCSIDEHQRPNYELAVLFGGSFATQIDGRKLELTSNGSEGIIYLPMQLHQHEIEGGTMIFSLFFNCEPVNKSGVRQLTRLNELVEKQKYRVRLPDDFMADFDFIARNAFQKNGLGISIIRSRLRELMEKLLQLNFAPGLFHFKAGDVPVNHTTSQVCEIKQIIENYINRPIPKNEFESRFNLGMHRLNELFKSVENKTINQYLSELRLARALHLLTNGDSDISDIAASTGFGSLQQFSMAFKRKYGRSPREMRHCGAVQK